MTSTTRGFEVGEQPVLSLDHVSADVTTRTGPANQISITVEGSQRYIDSLTIEQAGDTVTIREPESAGGDGMTVISTGRSGMRNVFVSGSGGVAAGVITGSVITGSGKIVVNGVDVTKLAREAAGAVEDEPDPVITVTVPVGTNVATERSARVAIEHVGGRVQGTVGGQGWLGATAVVSARLTVSGQSTARVRVTGGTLTAIVSGQSNLRFLGEGTDVNLTVSGQSSVGGDGTFESISGPISGQSSATFVGRVGSDSLSTSGQSTATVNGRPSGSRSAPRSGSGWNF